jgi:hypothetical protein
MTLLAPAFLLGLLAIGLPLWLHRLSSENPNKQSFSSLMFLEPGEPRRVLAKRLQYLLLLALRIALLVLLALTFTGPLIQRSAQGGAGQAARLHLIVMDTSASMRLGNRWARARREAEAVLGDLNANDSVQLLAAGRRLQLVSERTTDTALLRRQLVTLEPGLFHIDYGQVMSALDGMLGNVERPVVLHLITDIQQSSLPTRFAELAPKRPLELRVHDVSAAGETNWTVESVGVSPTSGEVHAGVRSYADEAAEKTLVLELNGREVASKAVTVPARGSVGVDFDPPELASGSNRVRVSLSPSDDLAVDDQRFLVIERPEPQSVLVVSGDPAGRETLFLGSAIETLQTLALRVERVTPGALAERGLGSYAFIVVTDAGVLADADRRLLSDYVRAGGALLMGFGPRSTGLADVPVTGETLRAFASSPAAGGDGYAAVGASDAGHPALSGGASLRRAKFFRYASIEPAADDRVLVSLDEGSPLVVERELGSGRVLLFASSLDREWNDLPLQPAFVPFVAGMARYLAGGAGMSHDARLGSTLALRAMGLQGGQIFDPRGEKALQLGERSADVLLTEVGFYEVTGGGATELVAVNLDPAEADVSRIDEPTLQRWRGLGSASAPTPTSTEASPAEPVPTPIWPWLLLLLAVAAVMETVAGNWHLRVRRGIAT